jgi:hypothetical protein
MAVGFNESSGALAEQLVNGVWSSINPPPPTPDALLFGVSCVSDRFCMAVGEVAPGAYMTQQPLIEQFDGSGWTEQVVPTLNANANVTLDSVSCVSTTFCMAVGQSPGTGPALVAEFNGTSWSLLTTPLASSNPSDGIQLEGVSCISATFCMVAGANPVAMAQFNGSTWNFDATPAGSEGYDDVTCSSVQLCVANTGGSVSSPMQAYNGSTWSDVSSPEVPTNAATGMTYPAMKAVGCVVAGSCFATGASGELGYVEEFDGTGWELLPGVTFPVPGGELNNGISCVADTECLVAGTVAAVEPFAELETPAPTTRPVVTVTPGAPTPGQTVAIVSTLAYTQVGGVVPGGTVEYFLDGQPITGCASILIEPGGGGPTAECDVEFVQPGVYRITVTYSGDEYFLGSTSANVNVVVGGGQPGLGYWEVASDGGVFTYGSASFYGSTGGMHLNSPVVGVAAAPGGGGYWEVASDGGIFAYGDASFYGSAGGTHLNRPIVGMTATPDGGGYWEVASDGGIFAYGDAAFYGSTGGTHLNSPIVGIAETADGGGYWEVASDGGVFAYGDAAFYGSIGGTHLNRPIVGMAATADGGGYWEVASDGGIFAYGDASFFGSTGGIHLNSPIVGMATTPDGGGYWEAASDGGIFAYGDAAFYGSAGGMRLNRPVVAMATT